MGRDTPPLPTAPAHPAAATMPARKPGAQRPATAPQATSAADQLRSREGEMSQQERYGLRGCFRPVADFSFRNQDAVNRAFAPKRLAMAACSIDRLIDSNAPPRWPFPRHGSPGHFDVSDNFQQTAVNRDKTVAAQYQTGSPSRIPTNDGHAATSSLAEFPPEFRMKFV